jgi:sugar phosphate isomerase/epimerase
MTKENLDNPLWAMAAGCVPDALPWDIPRIANSAGFLSSGMWVDNDTTWTKEALKKTKLSIAETGIQIIDVEVIWLEDNDKLSDKHKMILDVGLELGAKNALIINNCKDFDKSIIQFNQLCERAGNDIKICLEFGEFTEIKSLKDAKKFIKLFNHPSAGILIDLMHINRSNEILPEINDPIFPYIQSCDFWNSSKKLFGQDYIQAAVDDRCCLGNGEIEKDILKNVNLSNKDVSLEIRSKNLRDNFPDPYERAKVIFEQCKRFSV